MEEEAQVRIQIQPYKNEDHEAFRRINTEWLEFYGLMEAPDMQVLEDPRATIIDGGGCIWIAADQGKVVGTAALIKEHHGVYELAKMSVVKSHQGRGISKMLLKQCIESARKLDAEKLMLFSNRQLKTAISLYEKFGLRHVEVLDSPFVTADVKMELLLQNP